MAYLNSVILDVSIFDIVNAKVRGSELISNGSFKWRVSGNGDTPLGPTHYLYHNCNPCYVWSSASGGPISFDNTSTSITFKAFTNVIKYTFSKSSRIEQYQSGFTTQKDAQDWLNDRWNDINPNNNYTYDVRGSGGAYGVYRVYLEMTSETYTSYMDTVVGVSNYITELPTPTCSDPLPSLNSASVTVSNLIEGDRVSFSVSGSGNPSSASGTVISGSSLTLQATGLVSGATYNYSVSVNGTNIKSGSFTTNLPLPTYSYTTNQSDRSIQAHVTGIRVGDSLRFWLREDIDTDGSMGTLQTDEYTRNSSGDSSSWSPKKTGLKYDTGYTINITFASTGTSIGSYTGIKILSPPPSPKFTITKISFYSVDVKVSNVPSGAIIRANARNTNTNEVDGNYEGKNTEFTIGGLTSNTSYSLEVFISDSPLDDESFTTLSIPVASNFETNQNTKTASIQISNIISIGDTVIFKIEKVTGTNTYQLVGSNSYTRTSSNSSSTTLTISGLEYDVNYVYTVSHHTGQNLVNAFRRPFIIESPIKPSYTIEEGYKRAIINIVDTKNNDTISVLVKKNSTGEIVYNNSNAPNSITINNLTYGGIRYDVVIKVNDEDIDGPEYFYTLTPAQTVEYWPEVKIVAIIISNIGKNDTVTLTLTGGTLNVNESYTAQADGTVYGWDFEVEWDTDYNYNVDIKYSNGETIHLKNDTFNLVSPKYSITNITTSSFTINVFDAKASSSVKVTAGWMAQQGYSDSNNQVSFVFNDLELGTGYEITVSVADYPVNGKDIAYTLFDWWISTIGQGVRMNVYNNKPSPVKAVEWNKLVELVNEKKSKSISSVSAGQEMIASNNGNIYQVAEALGVPVASGRITAQFFLDLKTAINNILN